jgi:hypothetical protein
MQGNLRGLTLYSTGCFTVSIGAREVLFSVTQAISLIYRQIVSNKASARDHGPGVRLRHERCHAL